MGEMGNNFRLDEQYLAVGGLAQDILQIIREHYRAVMELLECIKSCLRWDVNPIHIRDINERLLAEQVELEDALAQYQRAISLLEEMERDLFQ